MSRAGGLNASQQKQQLQQQFSGGMNHGGYQPMGGGTGNMGFPSIGAPDAGSLGSLGGVSQPGAMHGAGARGIGFGRAPGPIGGPLHGRQVSSSRCCLHPDLSSFPRMLHLPQVAFAYTSYVTYA